MPKKKRLDPVTQYATDVRDGKVVVSRLVRLACLRHLRDLEQLAEKGLEWHPEQAIEAIDFFAEILCLPEETDADEDVDEPTPAGSPFILTPWQQFIVGSLMGWYAYRTNKKGVRRLVRRFRVAFIEGAKGCGKTPLCAGLLLYLLVADGERGAQMFCAAVSKDQARIAFADCDKMVNASPHLKALIDQKANNLAVLETDSFIRPISSEKRGLDGKRVHGAIIDEEHEHPTGMVYLKVRAGTKGRRNAIILIPTNSGFDRESICWHHHDYSRQVLEGVVQNEAWFAFVCHLDACEKCHAAGHLQPSDDCPHCDDWKTEGPHWLKANPNLGVSLGWQYLREQVREAVDMPTQRNLVRRLNFCQWTQQDRVFIPPEKWAACKGTISSASLVGRECYVGIDVSDKIDLSAVVPIFPRPIERPVEAIETEGQMVAVDRAIDVLAYFWMPRDTIHRRAQEDRIPYPEWAADQRGYLTATAGKIIDHDAIVDFVINVLAKKYLIRGIGIDQSGAAAIITRLRREFGEELVKEIPQGFRRQNTPARMIEALIVSQNLAHDANPVMTMCMANLAVEENSWREIRPIKINQRKRIDGGVALINAEAAMLEMPSRGPSVYATRGALVI